MRSRTILFFLATLCCLSPLAVRSSLRFGTREQLGNGAEILGVPAPEFELQQIVGGSVKSEDLRGKVVVLNLFPTWCGLCIDEVPNIEAIAEKYKGKNVRVFGIAVESGSFESVRAKVEELKIQFPILYGTQQTTSDFTTIGYPTTFVLTRNWTFHNKYLGRLLNRRQLIENEIESLLQ
jgi:peroxiredoxin